MTTYNVYIFSDNRIMFLGSFDDEHKAEFAGKQAVKYHDSVTGYSVTKGA